MYVNQQFKSLSYWTGAGGRTQMCVTSPVREKWAPPLICQSIKCVKDDAGGLIFEITVDDKPYSYIPMSAVIEAVLA